VSAPPPRGTRGTGVWRSFAADESGGVLSVEFMLVFPVFITVFLLVVQFVLLLTAQFAVEYAATAAVRSAVVWIPKNVGPSEPRNRTVRSGDGIGGTKGAKIASAARYACAAVSPPLGGRHADSPTLELAARLASSSFLTDVRIPGGADWGERADVAATVRHDFVLRVPIARSVIGRRRLSPLGLLRVVPIEATATMTNEGRAHGPANLRLE
jgi:hypothetical protein